MAIVKADEINNAPLYPTSRLNRRERKVLEVAEQFSLTTAGDWVSSPATISAALDELAERAKDLEDADPNSIITAQGDLIVGDASADGSALAVGTANTVLVSDGTDPAWGSIVDANVDASAAIAYSKLDLSNSIAATDFADGVMLEATGTIAAAAVATLNATPVELIASPGAGKAVIVDEVQLFLDFGSVAYDDVGAGEDIQIEYATSGADIVQVESTGFLDAAADAHRFAKPAAYNVAESTAGGFDLDNADDEAVQLTVLTGEVFSAAGDSPLKWKVRYHVVDLLS